MKRLVAFLALLGLAFAQPAEAQSLLRDAETEQLFADMSRPIIAAAGLDPNDVKVVLLQDPEINAFVAGGQIVYLQSGLIEAATSANQVQGVIAHELGHVAGGHVIRTDEAMKPVMGMTLLSMLLGVAAMAAGAGEAGAGIMAAGQQAALGKFLAYSRTQEASADAAGVKFLNAAGISGRGMLEFFKTLQNEEFRYGAQYDTTGSSFSRDHPLTGDRIATLQADVQASPAYKKPPDADLERRFARVKAKLKGYVSDPKQTMVAYPETDQSIPAHYARAYAWHKAAYPDKAAAETAALVRLAPHDPYFLELQGQVLLESGKPQEALGPLREATELSRNQPLIATTFGHALIATEDKANYAEAIRVLRAAITRDDDNPFAWYQLGTAYELTGDQARAALATAEQASIGGDTARAGQSARMAMMGLTPNTPDWIRAQDIAMVAQSAGPQKKRR